MGFWDFFKASNQLDGIVCNTGDSNKVITVDFFENGEYDPDARITEAIISAYVRSCSKEYAIITMIKGNSVSLALVDKNGNSCIQEISSLNGVDSGLYVGQKIDDSINKPIIINV